MDSVDCVIVGAGVVGLAVARAFAQAGREVLVLEREGQIGTGISSRNSEVIHAGIYYPAGSLMAKLCVAGRKALYEFCAAHGVQAERCGKLIVATSDKEVSTLEAIAARAAQNGVDDLRMLSGTEARSLEPELACVAALLSPSTGILDSHAFMLALQGDAEAAGAMIALATPFVGAAHTERGFALHVGGAEPMALHCHTLVNCAGLAAPAVASRTEGLATRHVPEAYFAKGSYFTLAGRAPFGRLIYPVPEPGGLGVHLTLDLAGQARFGPDVEWVGSRDYDVDSARATAFYAAIRRYWPGLRDCALKPAYSGIRPKLVPPGAAGQDFVVQGESTHGVSGLVNLFGIESPGLTAALALADHVLEVSRRPASTHARH